MKDEVKRLLKAAIVIAEKRDPYVALNILESIPVDDVDKKTYNEVAAYISQFISNGGNAAD